MHMPTFHFRSLAREHDDLPAFTAAFVVSTFLIAMLFNAGFFLLLIVAHMALDAVKYHDVHGMRGWKKVSCVFRESLADILLLALSLTIAFYLHPSAGIVAVSGLLRAEMTVIRGVGRLLPEMHIASHVLAIFSQIHLHMIDVPERFRGTLTRTEHAFVIFLSVLVLLLVCAPFVLHLTAAQWEHVLVEELVPWRI